MLFVVRKTGLVNRRFLLFSAAAAAVTGAFAYLRRSYDVDGQLVTDPDGESFGYSDRWIVQVK